MVAVEEDIGDGRSAGLGEADLPGAGTAHTAALHDSSLPRQQIAPEYRVPFLNGVSELAFQNSDLVLFRRLSGQALDLAREIGDDNLLAWSLVQNVDYAEDAEANERAIMLGREDLALFEESGNKPGMAYTLGLLGEVYRLSDDLDQAKKVYERALALCRETGEIIHEDMNRQNLCMIAYIEGDYVRAYNLLIPIIRRKAFSARKHGAMGSAAILGGILAWLGRPREAARILGACDKLMSELGLEYFPYDKPVINQCVADTRNLLDEIAFEKAWAEGQLMTYERLCDYVLEEMVRG